MGTNSPACPSPPPPRGGGASLEGVAWWERESWSRGVIDLFLVIKGIIWLSWGIRTSFWPNNGADSAQEGRRRGGCPCHPWDEETEPQSQKCCPFWPKQSINLSSSTHPISCL